MKVERIKLPNFPTAIGEQKGYILDKYLIHLEEGIIADGSQYYLINYSLLTILSMLANFHRKLPYFTL